jgi:glycosyltransferase involved in cell wall biosynthesis
VHLACLRFEGVLRTDAQSLVANIDEYPLTSFYNRNALSQVRRFATFLADRKVDIVQTHDFYTNVFGMAGSALAGVKVRVAARRETGGVRTRAQKTVERCAYRAAHAVVANAHAVAVQLASEGVCRSKIAIIHNAMPTERVALDQRITRPEALTRLGLPPHTDRKYVTVVANMRYPVKDQQMFLRAAVDVLAACPGTEFLLAGEGELQGELQALASSLGLSAHVTFLGRCTLIPELLWVSDVCVLSSRAEGFPNAVLEYMGAGRPVVATDVGGVREAIGGDGFAGYLVPPGDAKQMAARIVSLLRDEAQSRTMGERGRQIIDRKFSPRAQVDRTMALYDRLLVHGRLQEEFWEPDTKQEAAPQESGYR